MDSLERESRNLEKIEEREGLYSLNKPLFICTTKVRQGGSVNDNASSILNAVSGITLIALVVTIVVLLILVSVSITVVFGDNGILELAKEAAEKTNEAVKSDLQDIQNIEDTIGDIVNNGWSISKVTATTSADGKIVPIPKGFVTSKIQGENTVAGGFVIYEIPEEKNINWEEDKNEDGILDVQQKYNQFVWIPVDGKSLEYKQDKTSWVSLSYNRYNDYDDWKDEEDIDFRKESVEKYGGFYIGRYETGVEESKAYTSDTMYQKEANLENRDNTSGMPVIKKSLQAWNYISLTNAKEISKKMYKDSELIVSNLTDSYAWDTICTWLNNSKINVLDCSKWGNYFNVKSYNINGIYAIHMWKDSVWTPAEKFIKTNGQSTIDATERERDSRKVYYELATGISETNKEKNIYDLAGNIWEMTTEVGKFDDLEVCVARGGWFGYSGDLMPVVSRHPVTSKGDINMGFRIVLYLKF